MKIVMSEVTAAKTSIESSKSKLQRQINNAKGSWKGVVSSDGLSGKVKTAIDAEINNYQIPLLTNYYDVMHQLSTEFTKAISDFKSTVKETSASAIIDTDALTTAESKFSDQLTKFTEIETKFKTVYSSISDLVSVSEVSGSGFTEEMEKTKKVLTNTKAWMATFNGKKSSKAISSILSQQKTQLKSLNGVAGLKYDDPKSLKIYQDKAFKKQVSKQHASVKEFEKQQLERERREMLGKHPAILAIHGQIDKEYNAKIAREINDKNYKKTKTKKEKIVLVKETDSPDEVFRKYRELSKLGIHPHTGKKLTKEEAKWFDYSGWAMPIQSVAGQVSGMYAWKKVGDYNSSIVKEAGGSNSIITPEMEEKILWGQRKNPTKNEIIGGHSSSINNNHPNFATETIKINPDGTKDIKLVTQFPDGNLSKIKNSTIFPDRWSNTKILDSIKDVGNSPTISVRGRDGATWHRAIVDGVEIDVIKLGDNIVSGYPTGKVNAPIPGGFTK